MKEFYKKAAELDILKSMENPGEQDLKRLLEIIREDDTLAVYFYENNKNAAWINLLEKAGEFETLGNTDNVGPRERLKAKYLVEVAGEKPEEVLDIISKIDAKDDFIQGSFIDALLKMPADKAVRGLTTVKKYLEGISAKEWYFVGRGAAQLMVALAEKYTDEAFEIAESLLEIWKPEEGGRSRFREIDAKFKPFEYEDLVFKYYKKLWDMHPFQAAKILVQIFERYLKELQEGKDYEVSSLFYISIERLDQIEKIDRDILAVIVAGICEASKAVIEKQPAEIDELLKLLRDMNKQIFIRIEMYLLKYVPAGNQKERINEIIKDKVIRETTGFKYEYYLLLDDKFDDISDDTKEDFLKWIEERQVPDDDIENFAEWFRKINGRDYEKEDLLKYEDSLRARKLFLVRERFKKQYEKYKDSSGRSDEELAPKPRIGPARAISPTEGTPISVEDMIKMEPIEAIDYVCDPSKWVVDRKRESFFNTPEEGLEGVFKEVIKQRSSDYAVLSADELMRLKPSFLSKYFYGVWEATREKKIQEGSLVKVLSQAKAIIEIKIDSEEYEGCFNGMLDVVGEIFDNKELEKEIVEANKKLMWEIVEPLIKYKYNLDAIIGEDTDPFNESINSVHGKTFEIIIKFGLILKKGDRSIYEKEWTEKIRSVLDYIIDKVKLSKVTCVFGVWLPQLYWLEEEWVKTNLDKMLDDEKWDVVWGGYMSWGQTNKKLFKFLAERGKYVQALEKIGSTTKYRHSKDPEEGLVEHLMIAFFNGWIEFEDSLLQQFFENAPAALRGHAASFLTTGFAPLKEKPDKETSARLKHYWEMRLEAISKNLEVNMDEAVEFLGWAKDSPIKTEETFELLYNTLELTNGQLGEDKSIYEFMEGIYDIAKGHELMALRCLNKAMSDPHMPMYFSIYEDKITNLMESVVQLRNDYPDAKEIWMEAIKLADAYGRRHIYKFRGIYEELMKKISI